MFVSKGLSIKWQLSRPGGKLGGFERHLLIRVSCHFAFLTTDGRRAVKKSQELQSTNHRPTWINCYEFDDQIEFGA
jgi:hypothetical protein